MRTDADVEGGMGGGAQPLHTTPPLRRPAHQTDQDAVAGIKGLAGSSWDGRAGRRRGSSRYGPDHWITEMPPIHPPHTGPRLLAALLGAGGEAEGKGRKGRG